MLLIFHPSDARTHGVFWNHRDVLVQMCPGRVTVDEVINPWLLLDSYLQKRVRERVVSFSFSRRLEGRTQMYAAGKHQRAATTRTLCFSFNLGLTIIINSNSSGLPTAPPSNSAVGCVPTRSTRPVHSTVFTNFLPMLTLLPTRQQLNG